MVTGEDIVTVARSFIGLPYVHAGRSLRGCDCSGLLILVCRELGLQIDDEKGGYSRVTAGRLLLKALKCQFRELDAIEPGAVGTLWFDRHTREPQHSVIFAQHPAGQEWSIIHAYEDVGKVVEHVYVPKWEKRTTHLFRLTERINHG